MAKITQTVLERAVSAYNVLLSAPVLHTIFPLSFLLAPRSSPASNTNDPQLRASVAADRVACWNSNVGRGNSRPISVESGWVCPAAMLAVRPVQGRSAAGAAIVSSAHAVSPDHGVCIVQQVISKNKRKVFFYR